jgi:hypothetical protein
MVLQLQAQRVAVVQVGAVERGAAAATSTLPAASAGTAAL